MVSWVHGFAWAPVTIYLALCLSQLHSKQHRLTTSVLWNIYSHISPLFMYSYALRKSAAEIATENYWGQTCDHAHALHSISNQFQHEEIPGLMKCDVLQCPFPRWSNRLPHLSKLYEQWCSQISQPDLFKSTLRKGHKQQLKMSEEQPVKEEYS